MSHKKEKVYTYPVTISEDGFRAEVTLPGYGFSDINRAGYVDVWCPLVHNEMVRVGLLSTAALSITEMWITNKLHFLICHEYHFQPAFYQHRSQFKPMCSITDVALFGKKSYEYHHVVRLEETDEILHTGKCKLAVVDQETRKSLPIPPGLVARFQKTGLFRMLKPMSSFEPLSMPLTEPVYNKVMTIRPSDADSNLHTNNVSYPRLCHDVASLVALEGKLKQFPKDLAFSLVKDMTCLYQNGTEPGDELDVTLWEEEELVLKFIVKKGSTSVFQCVVKFYKGATGASNL